MNCASIILKQANLCIIGSPLGLRRERWQKIYKKMLVEFFQNLEKTLNLKIQEVKVMNPKYTKEKYDMAHKRKLVNLVIKVKF